MPPRSRRSPAAGRAPARPQAEEPAPDLIEVEEPAVDEATEAAPTDMPADGAESSRSSRRSAADKSAKRSSRRAAAGSGRVSSRRELTPEQRAAKRKSLMTVLTIFVVLILGGGAIFAAVWFTRPDERQLRADATLLEVRGIITSIETALMTRQGDAAGIAYRTAIERLETPELGYAKDSPNETDPEFAGMAPWKTAMTLRATLEDGLKPRIERAKRDAVVAQNVAGLDARFAELAELDDAQLVLLEKNVAKFLDNPVEPEASRDEERVRDYPVQVNDFSQRMTAIRDETKRRRERVTSLPEKEAYGAATTLIRKEQFQDALAKVDELQRKFPDANLAKIRVMVEEAAKGTWETALKFATTNWDTAISPGSDTAQRATALAAARRRMAEVVERFGIAEYVNLAKAELAKFDRN